MKGHWIRIKSLRELIADYNEKLITDGANGLYVKGTLLKIHGKNLDDLGKVVDKNKWQGVSSWMIAEDFGEGELFQEGDTVYDARYGNGVVEKFSSDYIGWYPVGVNFRSQHDDYTSEGKADTNRSALVLHLISRKPKPDTTITFKDGTVVELSEDSYKALRGEK